MGTTVEVKMGDETIKLTKEELDQVADQILADTVLALHADELIRYDDGSAWVDSHMVELSVESGKLKIDIVDAPEDNYAYHP